MLGPFRVVSRLQPSCARKNCTPCVMVFYSKVQICNFDFEISLFLGETFYFQKTISLLHLLYELLGILRNIINTIGFIAGLICWPTTSYSRRLQEDRSVVRCVWFFIIIMVPTSDNEPVTCLCTTVRYCFLERVNKIWGIVEWMRTARKSHFWRTNAVRGKQSFWDRWGGVYLRPQRNG